jgi:rhodanese-related sulfurtransferase
MSSTNAPIDISPLDYQRLPDTPLLVDVRSGVEYRMFHARDAVNVSLTNILMASIPGLRNWLLPKWLRELPKDRPIAFICLTAHRSPLAANALVKAGHTQVFNVTGGTLEWRKLGLPMASGTAEQPHLS